MSHGHALSCIGITLVCAKVTGVRGLYWRGFSCDSDADFRDCDDAPSGDRILHRNR